MNKKENPKNFKDFIKENTHLKDFYPFLGDLNKESDRGKVLISCSYLDQLLCDIIKAFLIKGNHIDKLFSTINAPLSSFSARIIMAYAMGLLSKNEYDELTIIRKIRNKFAHDLKASFNTEEIARLSEKLKYAAQDYDNIKMTCAGKYVTAATAIILNLINRAHYVSKHRLTNQNWPY